MAVFRVERTQGYTVMSNYHLRDKSLSLKAKGLLSQMLSLPEDWDYTLSGLAVINRERTESTSPEITCAAPMCWWSADTRPMKRSKTILPPLNACGSPPPRWTGF